MADDREKQSRKRIKNALLLLLKDNILQNVTVAKLCDKAEVSRTTFYKFYQNNYDVLEEAVDDIIVELQSFYNEFFACIDFERRKKQQPLCELLRNSTKYHVILSNDLVTRMFTDKLSERMKKRTVDALIATTGKSEEEVRLLFYFQISGCIQTVKKYGQCSDEEWAMKKAAVDDFLNGGYLMERK